MSTAIEKTNVWVPAIYLKFEGSGDSGGLVEFILKNPITGASLSGEDFNEIMPEMRDGLEDLSCALVDEYAAGYENNEGGTVEISVNHDAHGEWQCVIEYTNNVLNEEINEEDPERVKEAVKACLSGAPVLDVFRRMREHGTVHVTHTNTSDSVCFFCSTDAGQTTRDMLSQEDENILCEATQNLMDELGMEAESTDDGEACVATIKLSVQNGSVKAIEAYHVDYCMDTDTSTHTIDQNELRSVVASYVGNRSYVSGVRATDILDFLKAQYVAGALASVIAEAEGEDYLALPSL